MAIHFQCLVDALPEAIGVEDGALFPAADHDGVIQGLLGGTLDYAELGASGYAKIYLEDETAVEPVLTTVQTDGSTGYHSVMVARKDSGMTTLADVQGRKLGFADPDSTPSSRRRWRPRSVLASGAWRSSWARRTSCAGFRTRATYRHASSRPPGIRTCCPRTTCRSASCRRASCSRWRCSRARCPRPSRSYRRTRRARRGCTPAAASASAAQPISCKCVRPPAKG